MKLTSVSLGRAAAALVAAVLCLVPFHGFITVWASTLVGHYTALRVWDDALLLLVFAIACVWLARDRKLWRWFTHSLLVRLIFAYCVLTLLLGAVSFLKGEVTGKALAYGLLVNLRYLVWFLVVLLVARRGAFLHRNWKSLLLYPAAAVAVFAVLQYTVLPHDFLAHFGYNAATNIAPIETINHNANYIRVQSFTRGANPLGAYLVVVLAALSALQPWGRRRWLDVVCGAWTLLALYATGSRSAWIGAALAVGAITWLRMRSPRMRLIFGGVAMAAIVLGTGAFLLLKNDVNVQNEVLHTQANSAVATTSNGAHVSAMRRGLSDVVHQPLGDGPGTAGPASVYNTGHGARIAENYYIQIAQETGWIGLFLLLAIFVLVALELYEKAIESQLALALLASFAGLAFVALLSHSWTDDTLSFLWWGFAGIALAKSHTGAGKYEI